MKIKDLTLDDLAKAELLVMAAYDTIKKEIPKAYNSQKVEDKIYK